MSRIWAAMPQPKPLEQPPVPYNACWWRLILRRDDEHPDVVVVRLDNADIERDRLASWEFFDGHDAQLVLGVDVFRVLSTQQGGSIYLDVLCPAPPTAGQWMNLTEPGETTHPDHNRWPRELMGGGELIRVPR